MKVAILTLTRDLGVNLAGGEIILNLKEQLAHAQKENEVLTQLVRQAMKQKTEVPRYHALVKVDAGTIQLVDEE